MKLCCDENVRRSIVNALDQEGHDVVRVQDELDLGFEDERIVQFCRETERILLTNDDDFFDFEGHPGMLFLVSQTAAPRDVATAVQRIETHVGADALAGQALHVPSEWA